MKFGVCDSAAFARDSMTEFSLDLLDKVTVNDLSGEFVLIMCREKEIAPTPMSSFFDKLSTGGGTFNHLPPKPTGGRYDMKIKGALIGVLETQGLGFQIQDVDMSGSDMLKDVTAALQYVLPFDDAGVFKARSVHLPELLTPSRSAWRRASAPRRQEEEDCLDEGATTTRWQSTTPRPHRLGAIAAVLPRAARAAALSNPSPWPSSPPANPQSPTDYHRLQVAVRRSAARALDRARQDVDKLQEHAGRMREQRAQTSPRATRPTPTTPTSRPSNAMSVRATSMPAVSADRALGTNLSMCAP